jgi:hypothetical protein
MRTTLSVILGCLLLSSSAMAQSPDPPPPDVVPVPESIRERVSTSAEGLVEEYALSGIVVRLNGRFQSLATATIDETGRPVVEVVEAVEVVDGHTSRSISE